MIEILCECERDFTTHVRVEYDDTGITMVYGNLKPITSFDAICFERLPFSEFEELRAVYAGGWDWDELWALVQSYETSDMDTTPMTLKSESSGVRCDQIIFHSSALAAS